MLNNADVRGAIAGLVNPIAKLLLKLGVTPDMVTVVGAFGSSIAALVLIPRGEFLIAMAIMAVLTLSDLLDGTMARMRGTAGPWGNFLDSTLDRMTDVAIFASVLWWAAANDQIVAAWAAAVVLIGSVLISYSKARAESVGATANVGIAERAERLIIGAVAAVLQGLGVTWAIPVLFSVLAVLVVITVIQRFATVHRQLTGPGTPQQQEPPLPTEEA